MCTNCEKPHGSIDVCALGALAKALEDRLERRVTPAMLDSIDIDTFWTLYGAKVVDWLELTLGEALQAEPAAEPSAEDIREGLRAAAYTRQAGEEMESAGTDDLAQWLRSASAHPEVSMTEAIDLGEVSRPTAYELVKR